MLRHVVLLDWKEGTSEEEIRLVEEGLAGLPEAIPQIRHYDFGRDAKLADGNSDFVLVADFESEADYQTYQHHPAHQQVIRDCIRPIVSRRAASQFRV